MPNNDQNSLTLSQTRYEPGEAFARQLDDQDPLAKYRSEFLIPQFTPGHDCIYLAGNSLGLQPKKAKEYIEQELTDWANLGVEGHFEAKHPWLPYHENLTDMSARIVGAEPAEVIVMNTLTVNLHLMMISFYRPTPGRFKVVIEGGAFPSDQYAVESQVKLHGFSPEEAIIELTPRAGEHTLRTEDIISLLEKESDKISLVLLGNANYLTGQAFEVARIVKAAHAAGCVFGLNLAHGAGNLLLKLHDWDVDFAVWCSYKYLNGGPGGLAGCFVHQRHSRSFDLPRLAGWWGHNKTTRFRMESKFDPMEGAEGWQLSNPPIFQLAALRASLEIFDAATMIELRKKSELITGYLEYLLDQLPNNFCSIITPRDPNQRGSQLSFQVKGNPKALLQSLKKHGVICDFREPNIIRATPAPLYVKYADLYGFAQILSQFAK